MAATVVLAQTPCLIGIYDHKEPRVDCNARLFFTFPACPKASSFSGS